MVFLKNDLFFSYKFVYRFLLIQQWGFFINTFQLPFIEKLLAFFNISSLTDIDDVRSFNYAYLFRFFFGKKAFLSKFSVKFHLGVHYYKFQVFCFFNNIESYFPLSVFLNDFLFSSGEQFFFSSLPFNSKFITFFFSDLSIFIEKKTNIGFYNIKDPLGFKLFFSNSCFFFSNLLFQYFKFFNKKNLYSFNLIMSHRKFLWYKNL